MRVLMVTVAREEELHRARKHLGYDHLVLVAPRGKGEALRATLGPEAKQTELLEVPGDDVLACLEAFEKRMRGEKGQVRFAVDGGTPAMSAAAFLACLSAGVEAWFLLAVPVRLPIVKPIAVEQRFTEDQAAVIAGLKGEMAYTALAEKTGLTLERVRQACIGLKPHQVVAPQAHKVRLTSLGAYYQRALAAPRRPS